MMKNKASKQPVPSYSFPLPKGIDVKYLQAGPGPLIIALTEKQCNYLNTVGKVKLKRNGRDISLTKDDKNAILTITL